MKIYWFEAQAPRRVVALAKHLGVKAEFIEVDLMGGGLKRPEYLALNPNSKAPLLVDGDTVIWEAAAIMAYLCIKAGSNMWPSNEPLEQVEVLRWISWNNSHWGRALDPFYFEYVVKSAFGMGPPDTDSLPAQTPDLLKFAAVLDDHLKTRTYVACDRLTIADFQLASMASYWKESHMPLEKFPNIIRWIETMMRIPAWAEPWPNRQTMR